MSLKSRRILFAFFVLIFCILVPVVLLYATGHTINWRRFSLEKTGTVLIDSEPSSASIFVDGKAISTGLWGGLQNDTTLTTSARLKNIAPGEHTIRLELYGYWPWEEEFSLKPDEAVNFNTIHLFKQSKPELLKETRGKVNASSSNGKYFAIAENNNVILINTANGEISNISLAAGEKIDSLQWSKDEQFILADQFLINSNDSTVVDLSKAIGPIEILRWNAVDSSSVWTSQKNVLTSYSASSKSITRHTIKEITSTESIIDFTIYGQNTFIIARSETGKEHLLIGSLGTNLKQLELPGAQNYFVLNGSDLPCLHSGRKLYIIDEPLPLFPTPRLVEAANNFETGEWIDKSILYAASLELRRWNNSQDTLLTRFGSPITAVKQLTRKPAIIVALTDSIRLYSESRSSHILTISSIKNTAGLSVSTDENFLYALGEYENVQGIYRLAL